MKTCTVCQLPKDEGEFYYSSSTDTLTSKCMPCMTKFNALSRKYKRQGRKMTTKEFREQRLYERMEIRKVHTVKGLQDSYVIKELVQ